MKKFFASCLGFLAALLIFFVGGSFALFLLFKSENTSKIEDNTVLHLKMEGDLFEQIDDNPLEKLLYTQSPRMGLLQFKETIIQAKNDERISGIYLNMKGIRAGSAAIGELRQSLLEFKESEKWIVAYGTNFSLGNYYLASVADKIYIHPEGMVNFNGLSITPIFFKKMMSKLKIKPQVFRVGKYKSAVEPYLRENISKESRLQLNELLQSIHGEILAHISIARNIPIEKLVTLSDSAKVQNSKDAITYGLVDETGYADQIKKALQRLLDIDDEDDLNMIRYATYRKSVARSDSSISKNKIAVVVVEGVIQQGKVNDPDKVNATRVIKALRKARKNEEVKAIVIRINSPGGSFMASDNMWREIKIAADEKPVIASMSNYAASGGYYLAVACDAIVAQPTTITGSIGVFSVFFDVSEFLDEKIGVTSSEVKTGQLGNITPIRPMSALAKTIWQARTDSIYKTFIDKVDAGRKQMSTKEVYKVAAGRVWTGLQAKEKGLVDKLGNYYDALELAAEKADITDYTVSYYPEPEGALDKIIKQIKDNAQQQIMQTQMGGTYPLYQQWEKIKSHQGIQARMPFLLAEENYGLHP